jgi:hypothetical protein
MVNAMIAGYTTTFITQTAAKYNPAFTLFLFFGMPSPSKVNVYILYFSSRFLLMTKL